MHRKLRYQCVFAIAAVTLAISPVRAQNIRRISFSTVRPDRVGDFLAATKEYVAVLKKGESERSLSVWHSLTGADEYVLVHNYAKWADLNPGPEPKMKDLAGQMQGINTRLTQCIESSRDIIDEVLPDFGVPQTGPSRMIRVLRTRVKPEKVGEYLALVKSEVVPAMKKSGVNGYMLSQVRYGGLNTEFINVSGLDKWGDLDGGLAVQKGMGDEGYQRFLGKLRPLTIESQADIFRFMPDSSYAPAAK